MPRNASDDEGAPITPSKKTPSRAKNRQIVRWTDEKLAFAFSEFRLACQKHRIDVKKPLEDAAKAIAPFVTGDALIQQLSKRRIRYIEEHKDDEDLASRNLLPPSTKASPASPAAGKTGTPKRRKTALQHEVENLKDTLSPSATAAAATAAADTAVAAVAGTPASSAKRGKPRATTKGRVKDLEEIKKELSSDSESEYTESPAKAKKKRVRSRKASSKKKNYADHTDEDEDGFADESGFVKEGEQELVTDGDEYVDEAGGTNTYVKTASSSEPSPTSAKFPSSNFAGKTVSGKHYGGSHAMGGKSVAGYTPDPKAIAAITASQREDSFAAATPDTYEMGGFVNAPAQNSFGVEDVFVDQNGQQRVEQNHMFMGGHGGSFNQLDGMGFGSFPSGNLVMNSFYNPPFNANAILANQLPGTSVLNGQGTMQGHMAGDRLAHTTSNSNSDSSHDAKQASARSSFATSNPSFFSSASEPMQSFQGTHAGVDGRLNFNFDDAGGYEADNDDTPTSKIFLGNEMGGFGLGP